MNLDLHLTTSCNMKCSFCGAWEQDIESSMLSISDVCFALTEGKKFGYKVVTLTGGEPLLHPDIERIISYASQLGYWICITTNGLAITDQIIDTVKKNRCILRVSFHTLNRELHCRMTGADSWQNVVDNIEKLKKKGVYYGLGTTTYSDNINEIPLLANYAWENKASFIRFTPVVGIRKGQGINNDANFYYQMLLTICEVVVKNFALLDYKKSDISLGKNILDIMLTRQCAAGSKMFIILDAKKNVVPCSFIEQKYELYEQGFNDMHDFKRTIQRMEDVFDKIEQIGYEGECAECIYADSCKGGCVANKLSVGLDINSQQPICYRKIVYKVLSNFNEIDQQRLIDYWTSHYLKKCVGIEKNKVCFRRLPVWEINFKNTDFWAINDGRAVTWTY